MSKDNSAVAGRSTWQKVWSIVSIVLVAIVVLIAVLLMGAKIIGLKTYSVISPSMKPAYNVGDLVYVKGYDIEEIPENIKVGDAITSSARSFSNFRCSATSPTGCRTRPEPT